MGVSRVKARVDLERWVARGANAASLGTIVPSGIVAVIAAYLSASVHWIAQFGAFGIFAAGVVGFAVASFGLAQSAKWRLYRLEAKSRARIMGEGSPFDPMAAVYEGKRLYLRDLAPLGRRQVIGKTFRNCEIIGPGTVVLGLRSDPSKPFPTMRDSNTFDVDCIEIDPEKNSQLAIAFVDCDFVGCQFYHMTLLFMMRDNETLHWITKPSNQPQLPDMRPEHEKSS